MRETAESDSLHLSMERAWLSWSAERCTMSKYEKLWKWIRENGTDHFTLTFEEIGKIAGIPLDHSFLNYKKELQDYGFRVGKISLKEQTVVFHRETAS